MHYSVETSFNVLGELFYRFSLFVFRACQFLFYLFFKKFNDLPQKNKLKLDDLKFTSPVHLQKTINLVGSFLNNTLS